MLCLQGALAEREAECRRVSAQLEALQALAGVAQVRHSAGIIKGGCVSKQEHAAWLLSRCLQPMVAPVHTPALFTQSRFHLSSTRSRQAAWRGARLPWWPRISSWQPSCRR